MSCSENNSFKLDIFSVPFICRRWQRNVNRRIVFLKFMNAVAGKNVVLISEIHKLQ